MELQSVNFEQAKSLKELGFPQETDSWNYYDIEGNCVPHLKKGGHKEYCCDAPTLELAAKWLRDEREFYINIRYLFMTSIIYSEPEYALYYGTKESGEILLAGIFNSYESALSAGIDKAIEILKSR